MGKHKRLKRAAAGLLAAALALAGLPGGTGGLLAKDTVLTASADEFAVSDDLMALQSCSINSHEYYDACVDVVNNSVIDIGNNKKSSLTITGDFNIYDGSSINLYNGSYLIIYGDLYVGSNVTISCYDNSKVIIYTPDGQLGIGVPSSSTVDADHDFLGVRLPNLRYVPTGITSKNYFESDGEYYLFTGTDYTNAKFDKIKENAKTVLLKEICTVSESGMMFSPDAYQLYQYAVENKDLRLPLRGFTVDGDTCDSMYIREGEYDNIFYINYFLTRFRESAGYGATYITTVYEGRDVMNVPEVTLKQVKMIVSVDLTMYFIFENASGKSLNDFSVVMTGPCAENRMHQEIVYDSVLNDYVVKATIPINHITELVELQLYYKDTKIGDPYVTTMERYLQQLSGIGNQTKDVCDSILFFGKAASNYFNGEDNDISQTVSDYVAKYNLDPEHIDETFGVNKPTFSSEDGKVSLVLDTTITLRCYLTLLEKVNFLKEGDDFAGYEVKKDEYGLYVELSGISPCNMVSKFLSFSATNPSTGVKTSFNYNCYVWPYRVMTDESLRSDTDLYNLAVSIYVYARTCRDLAQSVTSG